MKLDTNKRKIFRVRNKLKKVHGNNRFRLSISRSLKNITAQLIDSSSGKVLATVSTQQKALKSTNGGNIEAASKVGGEIAKKAIELGHKKVTFDRSGYKYHGRVKALADGARDGGLEF